MATASKGNSYTKDTVSHIKYYGQRFFSIIDYGDLTNAQSAGLRSLVAAQSGLGLQQPMSRMCNIQVSKEYCNNNKTAYAGTSNENFLSHFQEGDCS